MYFAFQQLLFDIKRFTYYCLFRSKFTILSRIVFVSLVITVSFCFVNVVVAQSFGIENVGNIMINMISSAILFLSKYVMAFGIFLLEFFIEAAAYNGFSDAPPVLLGWFMIRDVANMFFVIALLVIAFGTILGLDNYEWKKTLGKLIIAAILINFSKLIAQFIIDIAHVFTMTFLNAISATAGGNLIAMFSFDKLFNVLAPQPDPNSVFGASDDIRFDIFASAVLILVFSVMAMVTIGAYTIIMITRIAALWVAIILSPLAYILSVLPPTERYASEYWSQFTNYVIAAPVMVFFLWIAFASFGSGNIASEIGVNPGSGASIAGGSGAVIQGLPTNPSVGLSEAGTWENMSSFIIAIVFLVVGIERVQALNVKGGSLAQTAVSWGKSTVAIASGYAAGRYLYEGATDLGKKGIKAAAYHAPLGGRFWKSTGTAVAGRVGYEWNKRKQVREEKYAAWEKKQQKEGNTGRVFAGRALGVATGGLIVGQTAARYEKIAGDWKDAAERQKFITDESFGTGSTTEAGKVKTNVTARKRSLEQMLEEKKAKKVEQEEIDIIQRVEDAASSGKKADFHEQSAVDKLGVAAADRYARGELGKEKTVYDGRRAAGVLRKNGKELEAQSVMKSAYAKNLKAEQEVFLNMDYSTRIQTATKIASNMQTTTNPEDLKKMRSDMVKLLTLAAENGEEEYSEMLGEVLQQVHGNNDFEMNREVEGQRILEATTGRVINNQGDFLSAEKSLSGTQTFRNSGESQAAMAALAGALKKQVSEGGIRGVGAIVEGTPGDATKFGTDSDEFTPINYRFAMHNFGGTTMNTRAAEDLKRKKGTEEYFQRKINFKNTTTSHRFMNMKGDKIQGISDDAAKQMVESLGGFGDQREVASGFSGDFASTNEATQFANDVAREEFKNRVLIPLKAKYASPNLQSVFNKLMETQFSDFAGPPGVVPPTNAYQINLY